MNILLTGATGYIGSRVAEVLSSAGHHIICVVRKTSKIEPLTRLGVTIYEADLRYKEALSHLPQHLDAVLHLAAHVDFSAVSEQAWQEMIDANIRASENLFLAVVKKNPRLGKFVYFSSLASVGFQRGKAVDNLTKPDPDTLYGKTKYESEVALTRLGAAHGTPLIILRPSLVYGKHDRKSDFLKSVRLIKWGIFPVFGDGENIMSPVIYLDDLVEICTRFLDSTARGTYICANNEEFTINRFVGTISKKLNKKYGAVKIPVILGQALILPIEIICKVSNKAAPLTTRRVRDLSIDRKFRRIHEDLDAAINCHPRTKLEQGVDIVVDWYRENHLI